MTSTIVHSSFACRIVDFCRPLFSRDPVTRELGRQLLHAGTSVGANLEEAQASQSRPDFRSKIAIARKESRESRYWLRLIAYAEPPLRARTTSLIDESTQIYKILTTIKMNSEANAGESQTTAKTNGMSKSFNYSELSRANAGCLHVAVSGRGTTRSRKRPLLVSIWRSCVGYSGLSRRHSVFPFGIRHSSFVVRN
jgi:four helix bundle protein